MAKLKAEASFVVRTYATEYEAEALRIQVFEMMDQQSTKSEGDLMKRKNYTIQSSAIERDICDDLLKHPRTQLLNEDQRRSVDNRNSHVPRTGNLTLGSQKSLIEVSDVLCQLLK